jgi:hypothetical protein
MSTGAFWSNPSSITSCTYGLSPANFMNIEPMRAAYRAPFQCVKWVI